MNKESTLRGSGFAFAPIPLIPPLQKEEDFVPPNTKQYRNTDVQNLFLTGLRVLNIPELTCSIKRLFSFEHWDFGVLREMRRIFQSMDGEPGLEEPIVESYQAVQPPSIKMVCPVMKSDAFEAKKMTIPSSSSGWPHRFMGVRSTINWYRSGSFLSWATRGVSK